VIHPEGNASIPARSFFERFGFHLLFLVVILKFLLLSAYACYLHQAVVIPGVLAMGTPSNTCLKYRSAPNSITFLCERPNFTVGTIGIIVGGQAIRVVWNQKKLRLLKTPGLDNGRWTYEAFDRDKDYEILRWTAKRISEGQKIDSAEHAEIYAYFSLKDVVIFYQGPWGGVKDFILLLDTVQMDNKKPA